MSPSLAHITSWLIEYKYSFLFPAVAVEGPIVTVIAGLLVSLGYIQFLVAYAVIVAGDLAGDSIYYTLGYWGGERFIRKWGRYIGATTEGMVKLEDHFKNHARRTLFLGKLSHGIGAPILVAAGVAKMPYREFFWYNFLPTLPKSLILLLVGFYFGETYIHISKYFDYTAAITAGAGILLTVIYYIIKAKAEKASS